MHVTRWPFGQLIDHVSRGPTLSRHPEDLQRESAFHKKFVTIVSDSKFKKKTFPSIIIRILSSWLAFGP